MDSSIIITSIGIGVALFAGLIIFWFFHTVAKRRMGADQSTLAVQNSSTSNDLRRHTRQQRPWSAAMEIGPASIKVRLKNISLGGAFVICNEPVPLNKKLRLYIEVPDQDSFALNAEVVWSNMNVPESKVVHRGLGIKFVQNTATARNRLEEALSVKSMEAGVSAD